MASEIKFNENQQRAIDFSHDSPVVVSAAAGSGKTAVLVERVIRLLIDQKLEIKADSLAIMTFTKNATRSLRSKLNSALDQKLGELSEDTSDKELRSYLEKQIFALRQASISTIDAFCIKLIKENPEAFDLPVSFTIADAAKLTAMQMQALDLAMRGFYDQNGSFSKEERERLFYSFGFEKDDALRKAVISTSDRLSSFSDAEGWLSDSVSVYESLDSLEKEYLSVLLPIIELNIINLKSITDRYDSILENIKDELDDLIAQIPEKPKAAEMKKLQGYNTFKSDNLVKYKKYADFDKNRAAKLEKKFDALKNNITPDTFKEFMDCLQTNKEPMSDVKFTTGCALKSKKLMTAAKNDFQNGYKTLMKIEFDENFEIKTLPERKMTVETFVKLVRNYRKELDGIKKTRACVDFSDCELLLLRKLKTDEGYRQQLSERFSCVIVDEFQDSNDIQAEIFRLIGGGKLFYVGDIKQSIYAFRGGNPEIMARLCEGEDNFTELPLNRNYRSRAEIIDTVNAAFSGLMTRGCGGTEYSAPGNRLIQGADYEVSAENMSMYDSEIHILNTDNASEDDKEFTGARYTAALIKKLVDKKLPIGKEKRPCRYSDFAVIMRNRGKIPVYRQALAELGIPSSAPKGSSFLEAEEIKLVINFLKIVDDPLHDEEMLNVLMSPVYRFTAQDMSELRLGLSGIDPELLPDKTLKATASGMKRYSLYRCLTKCLEPLTIGDFITGDNTVIERQPVPKIERFAKDLAGFRYDMASCSLYELIRKIYEDTDLTNIIAAFDNSAGRVANIRRLMDIAYDFETNVGGTLNDFLRFLERASDVLGQNIEEAECPENTSESVRIMTYHASKGLEFPICIMAETQVTMNPSDYTGTILTDRDYHTAIKYTDFKKRVKRKDLAYSALEKIVYRSRCGEELRLLYVAMTRAMEKLIMIGSFPDDAINAAPLDIDNPETIFNNSRQPFKWVMLSLARYLTDDKQEFCGIPCRLIKANANGKLAENDEIKETEYDVSESEVNEITELITDKYPNKNETVQQAKFSVTELARQESELPVLLSAPSFAKKNKKRYTGTEKGNAYHHCMEHFPFDKIQSADENSYLEITKAAIREMVENKQMTKRESEIVIPENIAGFFRSDLGKRMFASAYIVREEPFYAEINGRLLGEDYDGNVSIQGRTDMYFVEDDGLVVVDYKSDTEHCLRNEIGNYAKQVRIYGEVLPKLTGKKVKQIYLYAFLSGAAIEINENNTI